MMHRCPPRTRALTMALTVVLSTSSPLGFAKDVCVSNQQEFNNALSGFDGTGSLTIKVQRGLYPMGSTLLAGTPFKDGARPQDLDSGKDGKLDRKENPAFVVGGASSLSIECGYSPKCESRSVDPENTSLFQFGDAQRLSIRVQERAQLSISGCGFIDGMLWIVHGGDATFTPAGGSEVSDPVSGYAQIVLDRNKFYGSGETVGSKLVIQEEAGSLVQPPNEYSDETATFVNISSPRILLTQNEVVGSPHAGYCAVEIGDRSGPENGYERLERQVNFYGGTEEFSAYEDPWGRVELLHNSIGGNAGCGLRLMTSDPTYLSNNVIAGNGVAKDDITVDPSVQLYSEFNLYNQLETWPPKWPGFVPLLLLGTITGNPSFDDPVKFDLSLDAASPAIDAATPASILGEPQTDIVDGPRIRGHWPDMGAYEFIPN